MKKIHQIKLNKLCLKIGSGSTPRGGSNAYKTHGETFVRSQNVLDLSFNYNGLVHVDKEQASKLKNVCVQECDLLLNITGDSVTRICMVPRSILPAYVNQHVCILRADSTKLNPYYLLYFLVYRKSKLLLLASAGATRAAITKNMLDNFVVDIPSMSIQNKIASILSTFDDKIEINNKIIANLEEQAQALYKSWFIDFDPFQDGEFEESELGMIPKGWRAEPLENLLDIKYGKAHKKLNEGLIPAYGSGGIMRLVNVAIHENESILIPRKGTLNNIIYVDEPFWVVDTMFFSIPKIDHIVKYIYYALLQIDFASLNVGSAVPSMTIQVLNSLKIIIPDRKWMIKFNDFITPILSNKSLLSRQNQKLAELRDTLLPKLMSGEIELPDETEE